MRKSLKNDSRGFSLFFAVYLVMLSAIVTWILFAVLLQLISFTSALKKDAEASYYSELGVSRARWMMKNGYMSPPEEMTVTAPDGTVINVDVAYKSGGGGYYEIVALANGKKVTAHVDPDSFRYIYWW